MGMIDLNLTLIVQVILLLKHYVLIDASPDYSCNIVISGCGSHWL